MQAPFRYANCNETFGDWPLATERSADRRGEIRSAGWVSVVGFDYAPGPDRLARESIAHMRRIESELG